MTAPPPSVRRRLICLFFAFALSVCWNVDTLGSPIGYFDESIQLVNADLTAAVLRPNRDFFSLYPPLNYYLTAWAMKASGHSVIPVRLLQWALLAFVSCLTAFLACARPAVSITGALAGIVLFVGASHGLYLASAWSSIAFSLIAINLWSTAPRTKWTRRLFAVLSGLFCALSLLTRMNFGAYALASIALAAICIRFETGEADPPYDANSKHGIGFFVGGFVVPIAWFCIANADILSNLLAQLVRFPAAVMALRGLPLSPLESAMMALLPLAYVGFARLLDGRCTKKEGAIFLLVAAAICSAAVMLASAPGKAAIILPLINITVLVVSQLRCQVLSPVECVLLLYYSCTLHYYLSRADVFHLAPLLPVAALIAMEGASRMAAEWKRSGPKRNLFDYALVPATLLAVVLAHAPVLISRDDLQQSISLLSWYSQSGKDGEASTFLQSNPLPPAIKNLLSQVDGGELLRRVARQTTPDERVYVGSLRHQDVFIGPLLPYWAMNRRPPEGYHVIESGVTSKEDVQHAIADSLDRHHVKWLILYATYRDANVCSLQGCSSYLDVFIRERFHQIASEGAATLWARRPQTPDSLRFPSSQPRR